MAKMKVTIVGDASSARRAFRDVGYGAESMASKAGRAFGTLAKTAAFAAGAAGIGAIAITLKQGYNEWKESTEVAAQTNAVLKSTGHVSNVTAKSLDKLAQSLLAKSGVDDEAIKSGENMLLTFTNIRNESGKNNDIFDQTTQTLLDMTTVMTHGNVTSEAMSKQAIQLGKALNDPVHGLTALKKVGVTFSDAQKTMIEKMVASGDTMGAQKVILRELNKEFGGSAEALGKTLPGQINIARETFNNLAGDLFKKLVPALAGVLKWVNTHWPQIQKVMTAVFTGIGLVINRVLKPALAYIVTGTRYVVAAIKPHWEEIKETIRTVMTDVRTVVSTTVAVLVALWRRTGSQIKAVVKASFYAVKGIIEGFVRVIRGVVEIIRGIAHGDWSMVWNGMKDIVRGAFHAISAAVSGAIRSIVAVLHGAVNLVGSAARAVGGAIGHGIASMFGWAERQARALVRLLVEIIRPVVDSYNQMFGWATGDIHLPGGGGDRGPAGPRGPLGSPNSSVTRSDPLRGMARNGASVQVGPVNVHGTADAAFAQRLAGELATQLRGGRVPGLQQAIASV